MLDQITNLVKNQAMQYMQGSDEQLTDEQMDGVAGAAQESVVDGLKEEVMSGNISGIQSLLTGNASGIASHPIVQKIIGMFGGSLVSKVGLSQGIAGGLAGGMIPSIMGSLGSKFQSNDDADSGFDMSALSGLAGGGGVGDMLKGAVGDKLGGAGDMLGGLADKAGDIGGMFK